MTDNRFPRTARLLASVDYQRVFEKPRRSADTYFTVLATQGSSRPARLGLAISRKQARRAVDRNRLKRLIREVFRRNRAVLDGRDFVVMARSNAVAADNLTLHASLDRHFSRFRSSSKIVAQPDQ
ncbi:MAG: ribonuclease P protein component [Chromatiaceae bacterium]|nr:ribonuclease P protein component [Chromatiaceae bacterium]HPE78772.1 ribonuclease P protein component [Gammaproteobacteria bacterium]